MQIFVKIPGSYATFTQVDGNTKVGVQVRAAGDTFEVPDWYGEWMLSSGNATKTLDQLALEEQLEILVKESEAVIDMTESAKSAAETLGIPVAKFKGKRGSGAKGEVTAIDVVKSVKGEK